MLVAAVADRVDRSLPSPSPPLTAAKAGRAHARGSPPSCAAPAPDRRQPLGGVLLIAVLSLVPYTLDLLDAQVPDLANSSLDAAGAAAYAGWQMACAPTQPLCRAAYLARHSPAIFCHLFVSEW